MQHMLDVSKPLDRILKIPSSAKHDQFFGLSWIWLSGSKIGSGCCQMDQNSDKTQNLTYKTRMNTIFVSFSGPQGPTPGRDGPQGKWFGSG